MAPQAPKWDDLVPETDQSGIPSWESLAPSHEPAKKSFLQQKDEQYGQPVAPPNKPKPWDVQLLEPFDPKTTRGRINLAGTAAGGVATVLSGGLTAPGFAAWMARVLGPPAAAAAAGAITAKTEQQLGTAPPDISPGKEAIGQAGAEFTGQGVGWLIRRGARGILASRIGREVQAELDDIARTVKEASQRTIATARASKDALVAAAQGRKNAVVDATREAAGSAVRNAQGLASRIASVTKRKAAEDLADVELRNAAELAEANQHYERVLASPPSVLDTVAAVRDVVKGAPGIKARGPQGPAIRALDAAGKQVKAAAEAGPEISFAPIKDELNRMGLEARPAEVFGAQEAGPTVSVGGRSIAATSGNALSPVERAAWEQRLAKYSADVKAGAQKPNLPSLLGILQEAPDTIQFKTGHAIKELLYEAVNFDQAAKTHLQKITKGLGGSVREALGTYEPYNVATAIYEDLIPLYRKGVGKDLIKAIVTEKPDQVATLLNPEAPSMAQSLHDLLVTQSAAGGDAAAGRRAWDAVVNSYVYENIVKGGAEGLPGRIQAVLTQNPDFAKVVFQYPETRAFIQNLNGIGTAIQQATKREATRVAGVKAAGDAAVSQAVASGRAGVSETRQVGQMATRQVQREMGRDVTSAKRAGGDLVLAAKDDARKSLSRVEADRAKFHASSVGPKALETDEVNIINAFLAHKSLRAKGIVRYLNGPNGADVIEWAARSKPSTKAWVDLLMNNNSDRAAALIMRDLAGIAAGPMKPVPSHEPTAAAR